MALRIIQHHHQRRRRGTAYVLVLAITTLLVTLGIAATKLAKGQIEKGELDQNQTNARLTAQAMQDVLHKQISGSMTWRDGYTTDTWYYYGELNGTKIWYAFVDPLDDNLSDDYADPVVLFTMASAKQAFRIYSLEYLADSSGNLTRNATTFKQEVFAP